MSKNGMSVKARRVERRGWCYVLSSIERDASCPFCGVRAGGLCRTAGGFELRNRPHRARVGAYLRTVRRAMR